MFMQLPENVAPLGLGLLDFYCLLPKYRPNGAAKNTLCFFGTNVFMLISLLLWLLQLQCISKTTAWRHFGSIKSTRRMQSPIGATFFLQGARQKIAMLPFITYFILYLHPA
jgi:hypothetical protein